MIKILFCCHGNICRSPMAEFVLKDMAKKAGRSDLVIASVAVSTEELGNPVYPPARRELASHGINCDGHHARRITQKDVDSFDRIYYMDSSNLRNLSRIVGADPDGKISLLLDYTDRKGASIADPWYTRDFTATYRDIVEGLNGFMKYIGY